MAKINGLEKMSYAELADMEAQIDRLKSEKQNAERSALRQRLVDLAKEHGFDIHDLFGKGRKGTVAVKFRDPKNPENTWTGRGAPGDASDVVSLVRTPLFVPSAW